MLWSRFVHRRSKDRELAEEIRAHLLHEEDANAARGMAREEARRQARLRFGSPGAVRERVWRYRSVPGLDALWRDLRFSWRSLRKAPGFLLTAVLVTALGIGVNTAVFSVVNTVLLKPLSYPDPDALVQIVNKAPQGMFPGANVPKFAAWRRQSSIFQAVAAYDTGGAGLNLTGGDHPQQVQGMHVSADYFRVFGAPVLLGRTFTAEEDSPGGGRFVVLGYGLWKTRYGGNAQLVGRTIQLDNQPYLVVGVLGPGFVTEPAGDLWLPFQFNLNSEDMAHYFMASARLKPGVTLAQADAQMRVAARDFERAYPNTLGPGGSFGVQSFKESMVGNTRTALLVLLGAVLCVLLIACANVANLLLARAVSRKRELATRAALGAGRAQIIRQLLAESLVISLGGGLLGLLFGFGGVRLLLAVSPGSLPRVGEDGAAVHLDGQLLLFTLAVSILTGAAFAILPALQALRIPLAATLNESGRSSAGFRSGALRSALVVSETALALILVIGASLLLRTFAKLQGVHPGFEPRNVLTLAMSVSGDRFQKTAGVEQAVRNGIERLRAVPGVTEAAASCCLPTMGGFGLPFDIVGRPHGSAPSTGGGGYATVSWDYFRTFRIPLLRGREFSERDTGAAPGVVIINQAMARQYWPKGDPLRDRLLIGAGMGSVFAEPPRQIIGVAADTHDGGLDREPAPTMYTPIAQMPDAMTALNSRIAPLWWVVRGSVDPHGLAGPAAAAIRDATGGLPVAHVRSMEEILSASIARQRLDMLLLAIFGGAGLLMAAVGVYGLMAYSVEQRTQELGIRMALGAPRSSIRNMVLRQGMALALEGVGAGLVGAFFLTRFLQSLLFGVRAWDPAAFLGMPLLLFAVALLAVWFPAARATRVDPLTALRTE